MCGADGDAYPVRFAVRSLGWVEMTEDELAAEHSGTAVNRCIVGLSVGKHDRNDVVGRWGDVSRPTSARRPHAGALLYLNKITLECCHRLKVRPNALASIGLHACSHSSLAASQAA